MGLSRGFSFPRAEVQDKIDIGTLRDYRSFLTIKGCGLDYFAVSSFISWLVEQFLGIVSKKFSRTKRVPRQNYT